MIINFVLYLLYLLYSALAVPYLSKNERKKDLYRLILQMQEMLVE